MSQRKKLCDCMNINSVNSLYLGITRVNGYIEEKGIDKKFLIQQMKTKNYLKNIMMF